jgi:pimeloyl-ACP methyl ester carboxylesterase
MRFTSVVFRSALLAAVGLSGCSAEQNARRLIEQDTSSGKTSLAMMGSEAFLRRTGRIDDSRQVPGCDGTKIALWILRGRDARRPHPGTVFVLHGLLNSRAQNFDVGRKLAARGYDVALIDHRAHGRSGGQYVTWGAKESRDVKAVADALLADKTIHEPLYVWGVSMGGATAVLYGALDPRCKGVFAVAPYRDGQEICRRLLPFASDADYQAAWRRAGEIAGFDPGDTNVQAAAQKLHGWLVVVHGSIDAIVPYENGKSIFDAAPQPKHLITLPFTGHATVLLQGPDWFADQFVIAAERKK